ncbi:MAG: MFS transporter, partial [Aestuariivirga sp.]|nr:MFS transporter [Aestuariivirga sp.]
GSSLAAGRFLSTQGGEAMSAYYVVFALLSIPAWLVYSRFIDRHSRAVLLQIYLAAMAGMTALLIAVSMLGGSIADFALYGGISVLEQLLFSLYMVMLADYLTAREMTRFATLITVALSAGAMVGGLLAGLLAPLLAPAWLMFGMPLMLLGTLGHFAWVAKRWPPAGERSPMNEGSVLDGLRDISRVLRSVGLAALLAAAVFLNIVTQCVSEYMVFGIYAENFPDEQQLASFFGLMSGALNFAAILIGFGLTGPLMSRFGVAKMNLLFPASLGLSFVAMMLSPALALAVLAHIIYDGFSNNVDAPVMAVNYNAIPPRYQGQIRVFNDSLIYPIALAVSGLVIWLVDRYTGFLGVGMLGILTSAAFIAVGWRLGRGYLSGLIDMLRDDGVDLDREDFIIRQAPNVAVRQKEALKAMLAGDDPVAADMAMRIVARSDLRPFIGEVRKHLSQNGRTTVEILARAGDRHTEALLSLWGDADEALQLRIAEYFAAVGQALPDRARGTPALDALVLAAAGKPDDATLSQLIRLADNSQTVAETLLPVAAVRGDAGFVPLLAAIAQNHPHLQAAALRSLADVKPSAMAEGQLPEAFIAQAVAFPDPAGRATGYRLAAMAGWPAARLVQGLADQSPAVRRAAITALGSSKDAIGPLLPLLQSEAPATRLAAIEALGNAGATDDLIRYLQDTAFPRIAASRSWRPALPRSNETWVQVARLAMDEMDAAAIGEVLPTLIALGHDDTVRCIRRFLAAGDERIRARAAEALNAIDERRLILPLLPLLDGIGEDRTTALPLESVLGLMKASPSPWLRRAAALSDMEDSAMAAAEKGLLDRLLFLRKVQVFEGLTLDDLNAIHKVMTLSDHKDGERIIEEGKEGEELFVLLEGEARVGRMSPTGFVEFSRLKPGAAFGEMALFGNGIRSADVVAVGRSSCLALDRAHFDDLSRQRPEILHQMCRLFANRLR